MSIFARLRPHARWADNLNAYLDGALDPARQQVLTAHLATCSPCQARLSAYRSTRESLRNLPALQPSRSFHLTPAMLVDAPARAPVPARSPFALRLAPAIGVLALLGFITTLTLDLRESTSPLTASRESAVSFDTASAPQQPRAASASDAEGQSATSPSTNAAGASAPAEKSSAQSRPDAPAATTDAASTPIPARPLLVGFAALAVLALAATIYSRRSDG